MRSLNHQCGGKAATKGDVAKNNQNNNNNNNNNNNDNNNDDMTNIVKTRNDTR